MFFSHVAQESWKVKALGSCLLTFVCCHFQPQYGLPEVRNPRVYRVQNTYPHTCISGGEYQGMSHRIPHPYDITRILYKEPRALGTLGDHAGSISPLSKETLCTAVSSSSKLTSLDLPCIRFFARNNTWMIIP
jgi:hypothetical protein